MTTSHAEKATRRFPLTLLMLLLFSTLPGTEHPVYGQDSSDVELLARIRDSHFISQTMADALLRVPRALFFPPEMERFLSENRPLPDSDAGITPAPSSVLLILHQIETGPGKRILIIGRGAGYAASIAAASGAEVLLIEESDGASRYRETAITLGLRMEVISGSWNDQNIRRRLQEEEEKFDALFIHAGIAQIPEEVTSLITPAGAGAFPLTEGVGVRNCIIFKQNESGFTLGQVAHTAFENFENMWQIF
jgi:protein-L-isoaspartate(D-aspartate) O-methyltransferase